jgi:hypothetical protein
VTVLCSLSINKSQEKKSLNSTRKLKKEGKKKGTEKVKKRSRIKETKRAF